MKHLITKNVEDDSITYSLIFDFKNCKRVAFMVGWAKRGKWERGEEKLEDIRKLYLLLGRVAIAFISGYTKSNYYWKE